MKPEEPTHILELLDRMKDNDYYAMALLWRYSSPNGRMIAKILLKNFAKRRVVHEYVRDSKIAA